MKAVVLGGGVSGYMVANRLLSLHKVNEVVLVSSKDIPTIGVGEGTAPDFLRYLESVGIKEQNFMEVTDATYKYGVHYKGWWDNDFVNAFPLESINQEELKEMSESIVESREIKKKHGYGIHFDCNKAIDFLRTKAESNNHYTHVEGEASAVFDGDEISHVLVNGEKIVADYYVNCASAGLFNEDYVYLNQYNNSAITCHLPYDGNMQYTGAKTMSAGWRWSIPLKGRIGYGYVFDNNYIDEADAKQELLDSIGVKSAETRTIRYQSKYATNAYGKNYATIGLAQNFLDPLDTLSLISNCFAIDWMVEHIVYGRLDLVNSKYRNQIGVMMSHLNSQYVHQNREEEYWVNRRESGLKTYPKHRPSSYTLLTYIGRGFL